MRRGRSGRPRGQKRARAQLESVATRAGGAPKRARAQRGTGSGRRGGGQNGARDERGGTSEGAGGWQPRRRSAQKGWTGGSIYEGIPPAGGEAVTVKRTAPASGGGGSKPIAPKRKSGSALGGDGGGPRKRRSVEGSQTVEQGSRRSERSPSALPKVSLLVAKPEGDAPDSGAVTGTTGVRRGNVRGHLRRRHRMPKMTRPSDRDDGDGASSIEGQGGSGVSVCCHLRARHLGCRVFLSPSRREGGAVTRAHDQGKPCNLGSAPVPLSSPPPTSPPPSPLSAFSPVPCSISPVYFFFKKKKTIMLP